MRNRYARQICLHCSDSKRASRNASASVAVVPLAPLDFDNLIHQSPVPDVQEAVTAVLCEGIALAERKGIYNGPQTITHDGTGY